MESITQERLSELLSSRYRRYTLYGLSVFPTPVSLARVADYVTEWEFGVPADELPDTRLDVYTALYRDHLPPLVDAGAVSYDQESDTLEPGPNAADLQFELDRRMTDELAARHRQLFTDT